MTLLLALLGCAPAPTSMVSPSPPPLVLTSTDLLPGQSATWTLDGAQPGERVYVGRARTWTPAGGPCLGVAGGLCIDLEAPVTLVGSALADGSGHAEITLDLPAWLPEGLDVVTQAVAIRGPGGADSVASAPLEQVTGLDRCVDVLCDAPPADHCVGDDRILRHSLLGSCASGTCTYATSEETCTDCCEGITTRPLEEPLGGGEGYSAMEDPAAAVAVVSTPGELLAALSTAASGEVVYVADGAVLDLTGMHPIAIPAGVTLAGGRGRDEPGVLMTTSFTANSLFNAGDGVRVTGLVLRGPDPELGDHDYTATPLSSAVRATDVSMEVDNCEVTGWGYAGLVLDGTASHTEPSHIHHNHIHHNRRHGLGYGVVIGAADGLIEHNILESARHHIAGSGVPGCGYEARYNLVFGSAQSHLFDMHGAVDFEKYRMKALLRFDEASGDSHADTSVFGISDGSSIGLPLRVEGRFGGALSLGPDDGVQLGPDPAIVSPWGSFSLWIRPATNASGDLLHIAESSFTDFLLVRRQANGTLRLIIEEDNGVLTDVTSVASVPTDGEWHHVAVTQGGSGARIYVDGLESGLTGTNSAAWTSHLASVDVRLGMSSWTGFAGEIDEVYLYDRAMTAADAERQADGLADLAGERIIVHHNTFAVPEVSSMVMRGIPRQALELRDNWFWQSDPAWAVRQINQVGGVVVEANHYGPTPPEGVVLPTVRATIAGAESPPPVDVVVDASDSTSPHGRPLRWRVGQGSFTGESSAVISETTPGYRPVDVWVLDDQGGLSLGSWSTVQEQSDSTLMFTIKDGYRGAQTGLLAAQALVDGVVVWSRDLAGVQGWEEVAVELGTLPSDSATVAFRLVALTDVSPAMLVEADVFLDDVRLGNHVVNPGFETSGGWTFTETDPAWGAAMDAWDASTGRRGAHLTMPYNRGAVGGTWVEISQAVSLVGGPMVAELWMDDASEVVRDRGQEELRCRLVGQDPAWVQGVRQGAVALDGAGRVDCEGPVGTDVGTLSMWVRPDTGAGTRDLVEISETPFTDYLLVRIDHAGRVYLRVEDGDVEQVSLTSAETVDPGVWHHLVVTQDGTTMSAWLDGAPLTLSGTQGPAWTGHLSPERLWIGHSHWGALTGAVDEVVVDAEAWSPERVAADLRHGLQSRLPLDEGAGDVADAYTDATCSLDGGVSHGVLSGRAGVLFDDSTDRLRCDVTELDGWTTPRGAVSLWVHATDTGVQQDLVNLYEDGYVNFLLVRKTASGEITVLIEEDDAPVLQMTTHAGVITDDAWHHVVVVQDGRSGSIWVDGHNRTRSSVGTGWLEHLSLTGLYLGAGHWSALEGGLADLRVYDRALRPEEIGSP